LFSKECSVKPGAEVKGKARQECRAFPETCNRPKQLLVVGSLHDQVIDDAVGFVDVMDRAITQTAHGRIVFFPGDVIVGFVQQFQGAMKAAGAVHSHIDRRMIVQVLAVVNCSPPNFVDGFVNLFNGVLFFFIHVMSGGRVLQMSARVA